LAAEWPRRLPALVAGWRELPAGVVASGVVLCVVALFALAPALAPQDPDLITSTESLVGSSSQHWLGTDQLGRDVASRVVAGARTALLGPALLATITVVLSTIVALLAGYLRGWWDAVISRVVDLLYSVPALVVAIVVVGVLDGGFGMAIAVLTVFGLPQNVRVLRAAVMEQAAMPYMEAARTLGVPTWRVLFTNLLPAILPILVASFFLQFTYGIVDLSSLSFLGLGVPPGAADWGRMLAENRSTLAGNAFAAAAPGVALVLVAVATNVVGDWLFAQYERKASAR
ncbi:MAG TPA: ABC transporter permease, partial [Euzebya sp.]|nr:ABC transporter permease [Euzebya sp.]